MVTAMIVLILVAVVVGRCAGACLRVTERSRWHQLRRSGGAAGRQTSLERPADTGTALQAPRAESPLEALQRRFARGDMSIEQYEREVGRLYGIRS